VEILFESRPKKVFVDRGYRAAKLEGVAVRMSGLRRGVSKRLRADIDWRSAIEPMIGHMKNDRLLRRNWRKGRLGDALHAVLCGTQLADDPEEAADSLCPISGMLVGDIVGASATGENRVCRFDCRLFGIVRD
jgi:hypothetical protein